VLKINSVADLQVGDVGFYTIAGKVGGFVSIGQWLIDFVNLLRGKDTEQSWFTHTFIVVEVSATGSVAIVEAMPRGARAVHLTGVDRIGRGYGWARLPLSDAQQHNVGAVWREYIGTPYSFLDYLSLALLHAGLPRRFTARRVTDSGHMICSQLVDTILCRAGYHLFADGRLPQDVTPGGLFRRAGAYGDVMWW
jgi:hypothetical protein